MGSSCSSCISEHQENVKLKLENEKLKNITEKQDAIAREQFYMINLLQNKQNAEYKITDCICHSKDVNIKDVLDNMHNNKKNKDYEYLVFSGGGIKGISLCGAVLALDQMNILYNPDKTSKIKGYAGTSVGSIIAALLAVGYTPLELKEVLSTLDMNQVIDDKIGYIRDAVNFIIDYGIAPGDYINHLMGKLIAAKTGDPDYTISQLYKDKNIKLVLVGTDLNTERSRYFYYNSPNQPDRDISIRRAIRISMSIPFIFEPVKHDNDLCVDGGMLDNYPLHVFDGEYPGDLKARLNLTPPNLKVLGINIMSDTEIESYSLIKRQEIKNAVSYGMCFLSTFLAENERRNMTPSYWHRTVSIITPSYSVTNFELTKEQRDELYNLGIKYTKDFFTEEGEEDKSIMFEVTI